MRAAIVATLALLLALASPSHASSGRTEIEPYTVGGGLASTAIHFCDTDEGNLGGVCFRLDGTEAFADIEVQDRLPGGVPASARTYGGDNQPLSRKVFCTSAQLMPIPAEARKLIVFIGPLADSEKLEACDIRGPPIPGSYGNVTARLY